MLARKIEPFYEDYDFTNDWFAPQAGAWREMFGVLKPKRLLEVGCYEGRATTFMIEETAKYCEPSITCIDTWAGGFDLTPEAMRGVKDRFDHNTAVAMQRVGVDRFALRTIREKSMIALAQLIGEMDDATMTDAPHEGQFDFIYIDASHTAPDVLTDAVLAFNLLPVGGVIVFDDYMWALEKPNELDLLNMPKFAIDTFVNMFARKLAFRPFGVNNWQFLVQKTAA
jgi:predicted O-methyltransferase YrrM